MSVRQRFVASRTGDLPPDAKATLVPDERIEYPLTCFDRTCIALLLVVALSTLVVASLALHYAAAAHAELAAQ